MVPVLCNLVRSGFPLALLSSRQAKKEIATQTEPFDPSGFRLLVFDVSVTGDNPGAGGAVKQGVKERGPLGHPDIPVETTRFPSMPGPQKGGRNGG